MRKYIIQKVKKQNIDVAFQRWKSPAYQTKLFNLSDIQLKEKLNNKLLSYELCHKALEDKMVSTINNGNNCPNCSQKLATSISIDISKSQEKRSIKTESNDFQDMPDEFGSEDDYEERADYLDYLANQEKELISNIEQVKNSKEPIITQLKHKINLLENEISKFKN